VLYGETLLLDQKKSVQPVKRNNERKTMKTKKKPYHLAMYVENCCPKVKKFTDKNKLNKFVTDYVTKYPDSQASETGFWMDYVIMDIMGPTKSFVWKA
jgi:hypothetical protein